MFRIMFKKFILLGIAVSLFFGMGYAQNLHNSTKQVKEQTRDEVSPDAPDAPTLRPWSASPNGALGVLIHWYNPSKTVAGDLISSNAQFAITSLLLYENGELIETITTASDLNPGAAVSYYGRMMSGITSAGLYTYTIAAKNSAGEGMPLINSIWIGHDVPAAPSNVTLTADGMTANLSWTAPTGGLHEAYFTTTDLVYDIYRMPGEVSVATSLTGTTFTETLAQTGQFSYKVVAKNAIGEGGFDSSNAVTFSLTITTFPWREGFDDATFPPTGWDRVQAGVTTMNWERNTAMTRLGSAGSANHRDRSGNNDNYFITPAIAIPNNAGSYILSFWTRTEFDFMYNGTTSFNDVMISTTDKLPASFTQVKRLQKGTQEVANSWYEIVIPLDTYKGQTIYIAYRYVGDDTHIWYVEDVKVIDTTVPELDVPAAPENVTLTASGKVADLTWTAPTTGLNGEYFTQDGLVYNIYRMPGEISVAESHTTTTFSETIAEDGEYSYKVVAKNETGIGGFATSNTLFIGTHPDSPAAPNLLTFTTMPNGGLGVILNWNNPTLTVAGDPITSLTSILIYENDVLIETYISNLAPGGYGSVMRMVTAAGSYTYKFVAVNAVGSGLPANRTIWIGPDVPAAPENVTLIANGMVANLSWTAPTTGLHEGYFTAEGVVYDIYRMPANVLIKEDLEVTTFSETIATQGTYSYKVIAKSALGEGGSATSNSVNFSQPVTEFPWLENFNASTFPPTGWSRVQAGSAGNWARSTNYYYSSPSSAWHADHSNADSYLITKPLSIPNDENDYFFEFRSFTEWPSYFGVDSKNQVWISTTDTNIESFTLLKNLSGQEIPSTARWVKISIPMNVYKGETIYLAFRCVTNGDHGWAIDDVTVKKPNPYDGAALKLYGTPTPMVGDEFKYKFFVQNVGDETLTGYTVKLLDENDNVLAVQTNVPNLTPEQKTSIDVMFTPTTEGEFKIRGVIEAAGDYNLTNNTTSQITINVQPASNIFSGKVGLETIMPLPTHANQYPFAFRQNAGASQTVYLDWELLSGRKGSITELKFLYTFVQTVENIPVRVYLTNTNRTTITDFIPEPEWILVYEGDISFSPEMHEITIPLEVPFVYTGGSLGIMTWRVWQESGYETQNRSHLASMPDFPNRTLRYAGATEFAWIGGVDPADLPMVLVKFDLDNGSVSGKVTDLVTQQPIQGATVEIVELHLSTKTDANGNYTFNFVLPGTYQFRASMHEYNDKYVTETVIVDQNAEIDFEMTLLGTYSLSGKITGNDAPEGLEGVRVSLSGYDSFETFSNKDGEYLIEGIYGGHEYNTEVTLLGYKTFRSTVEIEDEDVELDFELIERPNPPVDVTAEIYGNDIVVSWESPGTYEGTSYIYDDGSWETGTNINASMNQSLGSRFIVGEDGIITSVDIYAVDYGSAGSASRRVKVDIYNKDRELLGSSDSFSLPINGEEYWINVPLNNIFYSEEFYAMVQWPLHSATTAYLAADTNGPNAHNDMDYWLNHATNHWEILHHFNGGDPRIYMIRVNANITSKSVTYGYDGTRTETQEPSVTNNVVDMTVSPNDIHTNISTEVKGLDNTSRYATNYWVYRFLEGTAAENWTLLSNTVPERTYTDVNGVSLPSGKYRYAVKAQFTSEEISNPMLSNVVNVGMEFSYQVFIVPNTYGPATGAIVKLTNQDGNPEHIYSGVSEANGVIIPSVWIGIYNLEITLSGFDKYTAEVVVTAAGQSHTADLVETIIPINAVVAVEADGKVIITWESNHKAHLGYAVYRLPEGQPESSGWKLLSDNVTVKTYTDAAWNTLDAGFYQYAVKAKYSTGYSSPKLSNALENEGVGINMTKTLQFSVYPNPVNDVLNIVRSSKGIARIEIFNSLGSLVMIKSFEENKTNTEISVSSLPSGVYSIRIVSDLISETKRVVKF